MLAESYLQEQGHETFSASSIDEALAVMEGEHIDVLFADIGLHGDIHAGLKLARQTVERQPDFKVLYATGQGITDGMRALFVENWALLPKPYTVDQLQTSLSVHFGIGPNTNRSAT